MDGWRRTYLSHRTIMILTFRHTLAFAACLAAGCTVSDKSADSAALAGDTVLTTTPPASSSPSTSTPPGTSTTTPPAPKGTVAFDAVPPLRIGMSANEARTALGIPAKPANDASCSYLNTNGKSAAYVMMSKDTVVRLEVRGKSLATEAGARVGDSEQSVLDLYAGRVSVQPHKYLPAGHYLVVTTPSDANLRLVFETDGKAVTTYRVGREPEVEQVEGCG